MKILSIIAMTAVIGIATLQQSCTPTQAAAAGFYVAGSDLATYVLGNHPGQKTITALTHLQEKLPDMAYGKVPPREMGQINAQLEPFLQSAADANPDDASIFTRIGQLLSAGSQVSGANPTIYQGVVSAQLQDFSNGMSAAIEFNKGRHDITDPPQVATAKASRKTAARTGGGS